MKNEREQQDFRGACLAIAAKHGTSVSIERLEFRVSSESASPAECALLEILQAAKEGAGASF